MKRLKAVVFGIKVGVKAAEDTHLLILVKKRPKVWHSYDDHCRNSRKIPHTEPRRKHHKDNHYHIDESSTKVSLQKNEHYDRPCVKGELEKCKGMVYALFLA